MLKRSLSAARAGRSSAVMFARAVGVLGCLLGLAMTASAEPDKKAPQAAADKPVADKTSDKPAADRPAPDREKKPALSVNEPRAYQGYTLISPMNSTSSYLIDIEGRVVKSWKSDFTPAMCANLLPNGHLLRPAAVRGQGFGGAGSGGRIQEFDWDGNLVWDFPISNEKNHPHHDVCPLPNGNVLAICWDKKTADEAIAAGRKPGTVRGQLLPDCILEIKPTGKTTGEIVWEWHLWDHLVQDIDKLKPNYGEVAEHPELVDINYSQDTIAPLLNRPDDLAKLRSLGYIGGGPDSAKSADANKKPDDKNKSPDKPKADGDKPKAGDAKTANGKPGDKPSDAGDPQRSAQRGPGGPDGRGQGGPGGRGFGGPGGGMESDWTHTNCVSYNPELDQIMLSIHNFSEVWIIDHGTTTKESASHSGGRRGKGGDLLYRWGNPLAYRSGTKADQRLFAQHAAHWIAPGLAGAGHMLVFNNGLRRPDGQYSTVDEVVLPLTKDGLYQREAFLAFGPERAEWSYAAPDKTSFFSMLISGAQRLPNGDTLICSGNNAVVFEVTPKKETVWKYTNPSAGGMGPMGPSGFGGGGPIAGQLVPSFLQDILRMSDEQKKKLADMQKHVTEKLDAILNEEQRKQIRQPMGFAGFGGPPRGPGAGGPDGGNPPGGRTEFKPARTGEIVPANVAEQLKLTNEQKSKIAELQKEIDPQLETLLSEDQRKQIDDMSRMFVRGPGFGPQGFGPPGPRTPDGDPARDAGPRDGSPPRDASKLRDGDAANNGDKSKDPPAAGPRDGGPRDAGTRDGGPRDGQRNRDFGGFGGPGGGRGGPGGPGGPGGLFRAYRYGPDYPGLAGKDLKPGELLENVVKGDNKAR